MIHTRLLAYLFIIALIAPMIAAQCEVSDSFNFSYTNPSERTDRVTFVLLNKTSADMSVVFDPGVMIVVPEETKTFSVTASADEPLDGFQYAGFAIRDGTDIVAYATAYFDLASCPGEEPVQEEDPNMLVRTLLYSLAILVIAILIVWAIVTLLSRREDEPRREKDGANEKDEYVEVSSKTRERRSPVNVDAMIKAEREHADETPWWLWLLVMLIAVLVIGVFIYLLVSGTDVSGFNYGAGINLTNATNLTNTTA